jgi:hypothetical protein
MSELHAAPGAHDDPAPDLDTHDAHAAAAGHDEGHGHEGMALGPIDWRMWAVGVVGVVVALIITAGFVVATDFQFNA